MVALATFTFPSFTMSSNPNEWMNFYQQNTLNPSFSDEATAAAATTTTTTSPSSVAQLRSSSSSTANLSRVAKPIRRRSRASRRTPTTLLNTDTTNFRAMVQQFTGNPNALFSSTTVSHPNSMHNISFGVGSRTIQPPSQAQALVSPNQHVITAPYHLQYQQQRSQPPIMFAANPEDVFLQRVRNVRPNMEVHGGGLTTDGTTPPPDTGENRSNDTFMF